MRDIILGGLVVFATLSAVLNGMQYTGLLVNNNNLTVHFCSSDSDAIRAYKEDQVLPDAIEGKTNEN